MSETFSHGPFIFTKKVNKEKLMKPKEKVLERRIKKTNFERFFSST
jgi:hypothetical protein